MPRFRSISTAALAVLPVLALSAAPGRHAPALVPAGGHAYAGRDSARARVEDRAWDLVMTRHFGQQGNAAGFSTILRAGRDLWAFGGTNPGGASTPIAGQLSGRTWTASSLPAGLSNFISDASAPSRSDIWAISSYGRYVLRWDGTRWLLVRSWPRPGFFTDIVATSWRDAWVFGTAPDGSRSLGTWHYADHRWQRAGGAASAIYRASVVSGRDIWAVAAQPRSDAVLRFDGRRWARVRTGKAVAAIRWRDVLAESAHDVWLLGDSAKSRLVLAHWNGWRWHLISTAVPALAGQLASGPDGRILATATSYAQVPAGLIVTASAGGRVSTSVIRSALGCGASDAVVVPGTGAVWVSGGTLTRLGGDAAIWKRESPAARETDRDEI